MTHYKVSWQDTEGFNYMVELPPPREADDWIGVDLGIDKAFDINLFNMNAIDGKDGGEVQANVYQCTQRNEDGEWTLDKAIELECTIEKVK